MYKVTLVTKDMEFKDNYKNWERQLYNDYCKYIDGKSWEYKTDKGLKDRIELLSGHEKRYSKDEMVTLKSKVYGEQVLHLKLPGFTGGSIDANKIIEEVKLNKNVKIDFSRFYDGRQNTKMFKDAYVLIESK